MTEYSICSLYTDYKLGVLNLSDITIKLNSSDAVGREGMTILELAQKNGIYIPTLCHDPHLKPAGACRVCLVEDEKSGNLLASCVTPITSGMVINTNSEKALEARRTVVKLLLAGHPDSCIICDKGNQCQLRKIASELGIGHIEFDRVRKYYPIETANPFIERDLSKCIMCGKCVRGCQEIEGIGAIDYAYRGFKTKPATALDLPLEQSICEFCGLCVSMCPVGALTDKLSRYKGGVKESIRTVCPYCGVGCSIYLNVRDQEVISVSPAEEGSVNRISLCVRGRYGFEFINSPERLTKPLIRIAPKEQSKKQSLVNSHSSLVKTNDQCPVTNDKGVFKEVSWDEALSFASAELNRIKEKYGGHVLAGIGSYRCTNEDNYLLQKFFRAALVSNNIDTSAQLSVLPSFNGFEESLGIGVTTNSIEELEGSDVVLVIGSDLTQSHPIVGQKIRRAVKVNGARLIVINPDDITIANFADMHLKLKASTDIALLNSFINVIINEDLYDKEFVETRTEGLEQIKEHILKYPPEYVEEITGILTEDIRSAARSYASAQRASIVVGKDIIHYGYGREAAIVLANLAMLTGNVGKESTGIYYLAPHNNLQGACDMGVLPDYLPGYQKLSNPIVKEKFEKEWDIKLPGNAGLTVKEIICAAKERKIRGMYIVGDNPVLSYPDKDLVMDALQSLEFLVVQDIFMSETAELANVVLPAASFAEKDGTFTGIDRRIQRVRKAIEPVGQARPDWKIIEELSTKVGYPMSYDSPAQIMEEIARLTPIYGGIDYGRLEEGGLQWPCPDKAHPGTKFLYKDGFTRGAGKFITVEYVSPTEWSDNKSNLSGMISSVALFTSGTGTMAKRSSGLKFITELSQRERLSNSGGEDRLR
jgi:predicted molibdopterin-dependent oxidoreductase YjgC